MNEGHLLALPGLDVALSREPIKSSANLIVEVLTKLFIRHGLFSISIRVRICSFGRVVILRTEVQ